MAKIKITKICQDRYKNCVGCSNANNCKDKGRPREELIKTLNGR